MQNEEILGRLNPGIAHKKMENMALNNYQWPTERVSVPQRARVLDVEPMRMLVAQMTALTNTLNSFSVPETVPQAMPQHHVLSFSCEFCGEGHFANQCPSNPEKVNHGGYNKNVSHKPTWKEDNNDDYQWIHQSRNLNLGFGQHPTHHLKYMSSTQQQHQQVHSISCTFCGEGHGFQHCPLNSKTRNYTGFIQNKNSHDLSWQDPFYQWNLQQKDFECGFSEHSQSFSQAYVPPQNNQFKPEQPRSMEQTIREFMEENDKRLQQLTTMIQDQLAAQRNLENQVKQIAHSLINSSHVILSCHSEVSEKEGNKNYTSSRLHEERQVETMMEVDEELEHIERKTETTNETEEILEDKEEDESVSNAGTMLQHQMTTFQEEQQDKFEKLENTSSAHEMRLAHIFKIELLDSSDNNFMETPPSSHENRYILFFVDYPSKRDEDTTFSNKYAKMPTRGRHILARFDTRRAIMSNRRFRRLRAKYGMRHKVTIAYRHKRTTDI